VTFKATRSMLDTSSLGLIRFGGQVSYAVGEPRASIMMNAWMTTLSK
jgi:hypothetical protein